MENGNTEGRPEWRDTGGIYGTFFGWCIWFGNPARTDVRFTLPGPFPIPPLKLRVYPQTQSSQSQLQTRFTPRHFLRKSALQSSHNSAPFHDYSNPIEAAGSKMICFRATTVFHNSSSAFAGSSPWPFLYYLPHIEGLPLILTGICIPVSPPSSNRIQLVQCPAQFRACKERPR